MGQRQPAIMHKPNSLQIFSNSLQSVFRKRQTELFIIHSDKEMLSVLADIWKYIDSKKTPIYSIWRMGVCKKPTTLLGIPLLVFLAWFWALALCYLEDLKKKARNQNISPLAYRKNALAAASQKLMWMWNCHLNQSISGSSARTSSVQNHSTYFLMIWEKINSELAKFAVSANSDDMLSNDTDLVSFADWSTCYLSRPCLNTDKSKSM